MSPSTRLSPPRVLVVCDCPDAIRSLPPLLESWGLEAAVARSGPDALADAPAHPPRVALIDLALPGLDAYEVARGLCRDPLSRPLLVALAGAADAEFRRAASAAGFDFWLRKPVDADQVRRLLGPLEQDLAAGRGRDAGPAYRRDGSHTGPLLWCGEPGTRNSLPAVRR